MILLGLNGSLGQAEELSSEKIKSMLKTVEDKSQQVSLRIAMLAILGKEKPKELIPTCKQILLDDNEDIKLKEEAAATLGKIGGSEALSIIKESFNKEYFDEEEKKKNMNYSLIKLLIPPLSISKDSLMISFIYPAMFCRDKRVRIAAIEAIGDIGGSQALYPLVSAIDRQDTRALIVKNISKIETDFAISPLIGFLGENDEEIRNIAIEALKKRDKEKVEKIGQPIISKEKNKERKERIQKGLESALKGGKNESIKK